MTDIYQELADKLGVPRKQAKAINYGLLYGRVPVVGMEMRKADALDGELVQLPEPEDYDKLHRVFDQAGFDNCTAVDSAMRNNCMLSAGFEMLAGGDDSYYEV